MSGRLRLAIVGTVHPHSPLYQELLLHMPQVEIAAVYDDGGTVVEGFERVPRYDSLDRLLTRARFEAALVTVPNDRGGEVCCRLVEAKKHVLADKPVCRTAEEMRQVVEAVRKAKVKFAVGYQRRFHPVHQRAKAVVRAGRAGALRALAARLITTDAASRGADHYLFNRARSGGGVLHWLGCHVIDLIRDLTGSEFAGVEALAGNTGEVAVDVEESAALAFRLECGAVGSLLAAYAIPFASGSPYKESPKESEIAAYGSLAKVAYEPFGDRFELVRYQAEEGAPLVERCGRHALQAVPGYEGALGRALVSDFLDAVRQDRPPSATEVDNLRVLEVIDAAYGRA